ncbi:MAG: TonB-dependent receptor, partial [Pseudomonadales bacterium]
MHAKFEATDHRAVLIAMRWRMGQQGREPMISKDIKVNVLSAMVAAAVVAVAPAHAQNEGAVIEEVIVTAQKREQSLQDVSLAITAVGERQLMTNNVVDMSRLDVLVPGLTFGRAGPDARPSIRGAATGGVVNGSDPVMAFYLDGVYQSRPSQLMSAFFDVERVEVLRGPQGTLFGRNSYGGALNVISRQPEIGNFDAGIDTTISNESGMRVQGFMNVPLSETAALRLSAFRDRRDGLVRNTFNPDDSLNDRNDDYVRAQLLLEPSERLSLTLKGSYWNGGGNGMGDFGYSVPGVPINPATGNTSALTGIIEPRVGFNPTDPSFNPLTTGVADAPAQGGLIAAGPMTAADQGPYRISRDFDHVRDVKQTTFGVDLSWDATDSVTVRGIFGYSDFEEYRQVDGDYSSNIVNPLAPANPTSANPGGSNPLPSLVSINSTTQETYSAELQFISTHTGPFQWVVGAFYLNDQPDDTFIYAVEDAGPAPRTPLGDTLFEGGFTWDFPFSLETESYAAYVDANYALTENLRVLGGARYTRDTRKGFSTFIIDPNDPGLIFETPFDLEFDKPTWKLGLEYDLAGRDTMLYSTISTGFLAGNGTASGDSLDEQTVTAYEIGAKNTFLDGRMKLNLSAFYNKYEEIVVSSINPETLLTASTNGGDAEAMGLE